MEELTDAEKAYIALVETPTPLRTKQDIADSLIIFPSSTYDSKGRIDTSRNYFFGTFQFSARTLSGTESAISLLQTTPQEERIRVLDKTVEAMMTYLPTLQVEIPKAPPELTDSPTQERFLRHLLLNRDRLLRGPPNESEHTIDPDKAQAWVAAQITPERQRIAALLLSHIRYISHRELLNALQSCVQSALRLLTPGLPVVFLVGTPKKSNYYISLLFAHFWLEAGGPIDGVFQSFANIKGLHLAANFLDIDDMTYSGNQTDGDLRLSYKTYVQGYRDLVRAKLSGNPEYNRTYMFLPRYLIETSLDAIGFRYLLVRAFMSEASYQRFSSQAGLRMPVTIVTHERIPLLPGVSPRDKQLLEATFSTEPPATTVYFNHKVADPPSTYLHVISQGIVPERMVAHNTDGVPVDPSLNNGIQGTGATFLPFVRHCEDGSHLIPSRTHPDFWELPDQYRCPFAWYKSLNYNAPSGGTRKRRLSSHSKSVSHRNLGSRARQKARAIARSSRGSRTGFRRRASKKF